MSRREKLIEYIGDEELAPTVDEFLFIEEQLKTLRKMPFIVVNPNNPEQQRTTPAAKQYKELLQQYTNILKILLKITGAEETTETSPLREWLNAKNKVEYR